MEEELIKAIQELVEDLAARRYAKVASDGRGGSLSEQEITTAIADYGRTLVPLPKEGLSLVGVYEQADTVGSLALDVPLWTAEEGRSDLTLSLRAKKDSGGYSLQIDDLHVL